MAGSALHHLTPRLHLPRLLHLIAWVLALVLAVAGYAVWIQSAF
jgi:hypothetical protein